MERLLDTDRTAVFKCQGTSNYIRSVYIGAKKERYLSQLFVFTNNFFKPKC